MFGLSKLLSVISSRDHTHCSCTCSRGWVLSAIDFLPQQIHALRNATRLTQAARESAQFIKVCSSVCSIFIAFSCITRSDYDCSQRGSVWDSQPLTICVKLKWKEVGSDVPNIVVHHQQGIIAVGKKTKKQNKAGIVTDWIFWRKTEIKCQYCFGCTVLPFSLHFSAQSKSFSVLCWVRLVYVNI